jgi:hypothetical protein
VSDETPRENLELKLLELRYQDAINERDRLRSARADVTKRLGPLPASAGIVVGLAATASSNIADWAFWVIGVLFAAIVVISERGSHIPPYRELRAQRLDSRAGPGPADSIGQRDACPNEYTVDDPDLDASGWLRQMICLERDVYEGRHSDDSAATRRQTLQQAFNLERRALTRVEYLFAAMVLVVVAGIIFD